MRVECLSVSKYRAAGRPGDDVPLILPDRCWAVFDGVTDVNGTIIDGAGSGRFAAVRAAATVAQQFAGHPPGALSPEELVAAINRDLAEALSRESSAAGHRLGAATTMAMMERIGEVCRFILVGDSGVRLNAREVVQSLKPIDEITTVGRVVLYRHLRALGREASAVEAGARRGIFLGLDAAVPDLLSPADVEVVLAETGRLLAGRIPAALLRFVAPVLRAGIPGGQYCYANDPDHPLGYAVLDGTTTRGFGFVSFERPRASLNSVEFFTDGYQALPEEPSVAAWEARAAEIERTDPSRTETWWAGKGSTPAQFFDDRTVIVLAR